ncbi:hypothetical protein LTR53_006137 [Teratosphaeriaceae sp. CCFEE 6253]|nr:hypothetical protein LTR53_006137 [Teratosphaeriaceae sp. CCFEE 6253]
MSSLDEESTLPELGSWILSTLSTTSTSENGDWAAETPHGASDQILNGDQTTRLVEESHQTVDNPEWVDAALAMDSIPIPQRLESDNARTRDKYSLSAPEQTRARHPSPITGSPKSRYHTCTVCSLLFPTAQILEQHARASFHRLYICAQPGCRKSYYRRDVYVRHKATHKQATSHECMACRQAGEKRVFRRKDHLDQHIRNCHSCLELDDWSWGALHCTPDFWSPPLVTDVAVEEMRPVEIPVARSDRAPLQASNCTGYQYQEIADLEKALTAIVGQDSHDHRVLTRRLGLRDGTTKEQVADRLRELLVRPESWPSHPGQLYQ